MRRIIISLIRVYRYLLSPLLGNGCRFIPSCSMYAEEAIESKGVIGGLCLSLKRIVRCQPWCKGGFDPVKK